MIVLDILRIVIAITFFAVLAVLFVLAGLVLLLVVWPLLLVSLL